MLDWFGCINIHLVLWLEIASILVDVQLVVCYNAGKHEVAKNLLLQTPRVIEKAKGTRTTSSIVAKNQTVLC